MSGTNTNLTESTSFTIDGNPLILYTLTLRVRGAVELMDYTGGVSEGRVNVGGTPGAPSKTIVKLEVDNPATTYYLNRSASTPTPYSVELDYQLSIPVRGGATLVLSLERPDHVLLHEDQGGGTVHTTLDDYNGEYCQLDFETTIVAPVYEVRSTRETCRNWVFTGYEENILGLKSEK